MIDVVSLMPLAERIGKDVAREWPGIEAEDVSQEVLTQFLENRDSFRDYDENSVEAVLRTIATRYASGERYAYTFNSAQYVYTPTEVKALLEESFFDPASWEDAPKKETDHRLTVAGGGIVIALMDLKTVFEKLGPSIQAAIVKRYRSSAVLSDAERKRVERGLEQMTRLLNKKVTADLAAEHDGPGSRTAMSNAQAQAATKNNY